MKTLKLMLIATLFISLNLTAQRYYIRRAIEKKIEKKYEPERQKGRDELKKITYEDKTRFKDPTNKKLATISYENREINKKGNVEKILTDKVIFGKFGEAIVMNEGMKDESRLIYNYKDNANYIVNVKDKTATKMPLINAKGMMEKFANKETERSADGAEVWEKTNETKTVNGYLCIKYIYTYPKNRHHSVYEAWVTNQLKLDLKGNYLAGSRMSNYKMPTNASGAPTGTIILGILYDTKGRPVQERELKSVTKTADENYFDLSSYQVEDVLDAL